MFKDRSNKQQRKTDYLDHSGTCKIECDKYNAIFITQSSGGMKTELRICGLT